MVKRIRNAFLRFLHSLKRIKYPKPQPAESPETSDAKVIPPFMKSSVKSTDPAHPGISPKSEVKKGWKILPESRSFARLPSPIKFITRFIISIVTNRNAVTFKV